MKDLLRKIGLSEGEIKVYLALLDLGRAPVNKIHEKVGIERRNIYDILNKLIEKGVITYVKENKKRFFKLAHPSKLFGYLDEKAQNVERIKKDVEKELPNIIKQFDFNKLNINAEIYRGKEGIKAVWDDMLNYKENRFIGSGRYVPIKMPHYFASFNRRRIEKRVRWLNLIRDDLRGKTKAMKYETIKFLPKEFNGSPNVIFIYGDKVANLLFTEEFFAFVIESKELADSYRKYHQYLWDKVAKA